MERFRVKKVSNTTSGDGSAESIWNVLFSICHPRQHKQPAIFPSFDLYQQLHRERSKTPRPTASKIVGKENPSRNWKKQTTKQNSSHDLNAIASLLLSLLLLVLLPPFLHTVVGSQQNPAPPTLRRLPAVLEHALPLLLSLLLSAHFVLFPTQLIPPRLIRQKNRLEDVVVDFPLVDLCSCILSVHASNHISRQRSE